MQKRFIFALTFAALGLLLLSAGNMVIFAQTDSKSSETQVPEVKKGEETSLIIVGGAPAMAIDRKDGKDDEKDKPRPIKDVLPDAKKIDGLIPMYLKKDQLFAEITGSNLNTDYLIAMAIAKGSGGSAVGGYTLNFGDDWLWQFRKVNDKIQVVRRNIRFKADSGTPEADAVEIAYSDSILYSLPIVARGENGGDVIDMASIFMSDLPRVGGMVGGYFARDRSNWGEVKGFRNNMEFRVEATYASGGRYYGGGDDAAPDSSSVGVTIHYSISRLPSSGYSSRLADNRIGYFTTTHKNFSKNQDDDHIVRYINRWNLQKADPSAPLSPPKKPIVFWIEKTVPFKYRNAVREGILEWNKAFEKVGFVNAIEVRQQSDTDTWDPEDINYNTFRWITSDAGFAMGPSHVNPLTGEILDADIIMDAGFVDSWKRAFDIFITEKLPSVSDMKSKKEQIHALLGLQKVQEELKAHEHEDGSNCEGMNHCTCTYARNKAAQLALGALMLAIVDDEQSEESANKEEEKQEDAKKEEGKEDGSEKEKAKDSEKKENGEKKDDTKNDAKDDDKKDKEKKPSKEELKKKAEDAFEKLVLAGIKDIVMHEVGHTLGLRHNFKASSWLTLDEINNPNRSKEYGFCGSVMDYIPINIAPKGKPQGDYFMPTLGPYDYLAIEYGYKVLSGSTEGDLKELRKIAARQAEKGNHYATDEDAWMRSNPDPLTDYYDLGANPMDYAKASVELYKQLLPEIVDRAAKDGESYKDVGRYFRAILFRSAQANQYLARNVAGLYINRDFRGDPGNRSPVQVVDAKTQRDSVAYICDEVFGIESFKIPPELYNQFGEEKWLESGNVIRGGNSTELRDTVLRAQLYVLRSLINPWTLKRLDDIPLRVGETEDVYTMEELLSTLTETIFKELDTVKDGGEYTTSKPAIHLSRRSLQESYFLFLSEYVMGDMAWYLDLPESCQSVSRQQLVNISSNIKMLLAGKTKLDPASKAYLEGINQRIEKVLDASLIRMMP